MRKEKLRITHHESPVKPNFLPMNYPSKNTPTFVYIRPGYWVLFFTLIGFGLRLQKLDFQPLWGDEGWSIYFAVQPLPQLLALTAIDIHPPLYYILLKTWLAIAGIGAEEARFFSVMAGTLLIPVVGVLGRRLFGRRVGMVAAATTAIMPLAVYYSQEVRMYGLVTLLGAMSVYFFVRSRQLAAFWRIGYVVVTAATLYTMYYAAFVVLFQALYIALVYLRQPRRLWRSLLPFIYVGLLYLPWVLYAAPKLIGYIQNKRAVEGYLPLTFLDFLGSHFAAFGIGHLSNNLADYIWFALAALLVAMLGAVAVIAIKSRWALLLYLYLFVPLLLGYVINQIYPFTPRFFERTLLLAAPAYWLFIAVGIIWLWDKQYLLVGTAVIGLLLVSIVSLIDFYTEPRYPNEDYRPLLGDIAAVSTPADTILGSYQWQLGFYHAYLPPPRPKLFAVPEWGYGWAADAGNAPQLADDLQAILAQSPRLWFPAYQAGGHIWEDEAEAAVARLGYPALLRWYSPQTKLTLAGAEQTPLQDISPASFEKRLTLLAGAVGGQAYQAGRDVVPVELTWRKEENLGSQHRVSLRLVDAAGRTWATRDSAPQAGQVDFTDMNIGDTLLDRHGLLTPVGAPPGRYRLLLSVRRAGDDHPLNLVDESGQPLGPELPLAEIMLIAPEPPVGAAALPVQIEINEDFEPVARLVGYSLGHGPFKAGETIPLTLFWESLGDNLGHLEVLLELQDAAGQTVVSHQQAPIWPATEWQAGSLVRDPHDIALPPTLPAGEYQLRVSLLWTEQQKIWVNGKDYIPLAAVTTIDRPHNFDAPNPDIDLDINFSDQARLTGMDMPRSKIGAGEALKLALYWQAVNPPDRSWTVFVHLTDNGGNILSQQDQIPGGGQFPTMGWLPGEYLTDSYTLHIPPTTPPGKYVLKIGMYDANTSNRLPVVDNNRIMANHAALESWPIFIE